ncbi:hypothetical protein X943_003106 [Babesia divergens]|uniref:Uncharacterized protein n=1 Tax=Babesia divergens TaxID=32595 RepID=A0AAD9GFN0_BABDI|nr:hypothetical protein X943_003106 [Babesia divergens]
MTVLGILRASALFLVISAFYSPSAVFCGNLEVNPYTESPIVEVSDLPDDLKDSNVESSSHASAPASQSALVFESSTWDDSHLASTILFLDELCRDIKADKFSERFSYRSLKNLSWECRYISSYLVQFTRYPLLNNARENPYKDVLRADDFNTYAEWLVKNILGFLDSMVGLHTESTKLSEEQLETDASTLLSK